jgi:hypothetical protein
MGVTQSPNGRAGRFSSFRSAFVGLVDHAEKRAHTSQSTRAPHKTIKVAEIAGRLQYQDAQRLYTHFGDSTDAHSSGGGRGALEHYDETHDAIESISATGASAVDSKYRRGDASLYDSFSVSVIGRATELSGEEKLYKLNEMVLTEFKAKPFVFQKRFFRMIMQCLAQLVVGQETWNRRGSAIMRHFGWTTIGSFCAAIAMRRVGKTVIATLVIAALCIVKQTTVAFLGYGQRATDGARNNFLKHIENSKYADCLPKRGLFAESVSIATKYDKPDTFSVISFYPSNSTIRPPLITLSAWCSGVLWSGRRWSNCAA